MATDHSCTCAATFIPEESTDAFRVYRHLGHEPINPICPIHGRRTTVTPDHPVLPKPCDSLEYAKGCVCPKCLAHQEARNRQYREERVQERNRGD